jgi:hypothetical protein
MGPGRHHPRGRVGLGLSGTVGSAVLYGAIVVFGIGSASPSALDAGRDRNRSVVLVPQHADIVPGSVKKLPQASPEPGRHRSPARQQPRTEVVSAPSPTPATVESQPAPAPPRAKESSSAAPTSSTAPVAEPTPGLTIPTLTVPELPPPLPPLPVQLPELAVTPLQLPVALPLDLPG